MIEPATLALVAATSAASAALGGWWSRRRALRHAEARRESERAQWRRTERRLQDRQALVAMELSAAEARMQLLTTFSGPPMADTSGATAEWARKLVARLRGLSDLRAATVADAHGLPLAFCDDEALRRAAAAVTRLSRVASTSGPAGVTSIDVVTERASGWTFRPLSFAEDTPWLLAHSSSGRVNALALDAAVAAAGLPSPPTPEPGERLGHDGASNDEMGAWLAEECGRVGVNDLALVLDGEVHAHGSCRGLGDERLRHVASACKAMTDVLGHHLPEPLGTVDLHCVGGVGITVAPLWPSVHLVAVTSHQALDELSLRRLQGRLRRQLASFNQTPGAVAS